MPLSAAIVGTTVLESYDNVLFTYVPEEGTFVTNNTSEFLYNISIINSFAIRYIQNNFYTYEGFAIYINTVAKCRSDRKCIALK